MAASKLSSRISARVFARFFFAFTLGFAFSGCAHSPPSSAAIVESSSAPATSHTTAPAAPPSPKYSFEQLQTVALYLTHLSVEDVNAKAAKRKRRRILKCDPPPKLVDQELMQLKSMIDEQGVPKVAPEALAHCEQTCMCGAYSPIDESLLKKHAAMTDTDERRCIATLDWYCGSELEASLRAQ